ncbi:MAG TPA: hypothetical protein VGC36_02215 [Rhizomicrobium sp.]
MPASRLYAALIRRLAGAFRPGTAFASAPHRPWSGLCVCECQSAGGYQWIHPGLILPGGDGIGGCRCSGGGE